MHRPLNGVKPLSCLGAGLPATPYYQVPTDKCDKIANNYPVARLIVVKDDTMDRHLRENPDPLVLLRIFVNVIIHLYDDIAGAVEGGIDACEGLRLFHVEALLPQ